MADKNNPLDEDFNPYGLTEGARGYSGSSGSPYKNPKEPTMDEILSAIRKVLQMEPASAARPVVKSKPHSWEVEKMSPGEAYKSLTNVAPTPPAHMMGKSMPPVQANRTAKVIEKFANPPKRYDSDSYAGAKYTTQVQPRQQTHQQEATEALTKNLTPEQRKFLIDHLGGEAKAIGNPWVRLYHGSSTGPVEPGKKFHIPTDFERGVFFTPHPQTAGKYAGQLQYTSGHPKTFPVEANLSNSKIVDVKGRHYDSDITRPAIDKAVKEGKDFVIFRNMPDVGGAHDQVVAVRPAGKVRSALTKETLLGILGGTIAPSALLDEEKE